MGLPNPNPDDDLNVRDDEFEQVVDNEGGKAYAVKSKRLQEAMTELQNAGIAAIPESAPLPGRPYVGIGPKSICELAIRAQKNPDKKFVGLVGALLVAHQTISKEMANVMPHLLYHCPNPEKHDPPSNAASVLRDKLMDLMRATERKNDPDNLGNIDDDEFNNLFRFDEKKKKGGQTH